MKSRLRPPVPIIAFTGLVGATGVAGAPLEIASTAMKGHIIEQAELIGRDARTGK